MIGTEGESERESEQPRGRELFINTQTAIMYRGYTKLRTRTVLGSYGMAMPKVMGPP